MLIPFLGVIASILALVCSATLPDYRPGFNDLPQSVRDRAALLWFLCWLPSLHYTLSADRVRRPIPFMPIIGILYALYYALSPAMGIANFWARDPLTGFSSVTRFDAATDYSHAINMAIVGWVALAVGRELSRRSWRRRASVRGHVLPRLDSVVVQRWAYVLAAAGLVVTTLQRVWVINPASGPARMLNFLSQSALIVLIASDRLGYQRGRWRAFTWALVAGTVFIDLGGGATAKVLYVLFAIFIGLYAARRRLPARYLLAGAVAISACVAIRGVMGIWRAEVEWRPDRELSAVAQSERLVELLRESVDRRGVLGSVSAGWSIIARRSSNIELLADVMRRTPRDIPFWDGFTYRSLVGAVVPRALWPGKPDKTLGQDFGHRYTYLDARDHHTSINLPVLVEFYINFGDTGIAAGMFLVGIVFGRLERLLNQPGQSLLVTAAGAPLLTQLFVMECDLSLQYGGLILQLVVIAMFARVLHVLHRPRAEGRMSATGADGRVSEVRDWTVGDPRQWSPLPGRLVFPRLTADSIAARAAARARGVAQHVGPRLRRTLSRAVSL